MIKHLTTFKIFFKSIKKKYKLIAGLVLGVYIIGYMFSIKDGWISYSTLFAVIIAEVALVIATLDAFMDDI